MISTHAILHYFAAATNVKECKLETSSQNPFFGIPHWWQYLKGEPDPLGKCVPKVNFPNDIWAIALALIDILLTVAGIVAVVMVIIAGVSYITSMGSPDKATSARKRITNALIGLGIVLIASAVVSFIGKSLGGS